MGRSIATDSGGVSDFIWIWSRISKTTLDACIWSVAKLAGLHLNSAPRDSVIPLIFAQSELTIIRSNAPELIAASIVHEIKGLFLKFIKFYFGILLDPPLAKINAIELFTIMSNLHQLIDYVH